MMEDSPFRHFYWENWLICPEKAHRKRRSLFNSLMTVLVYVCLPVCVCARASECVCHYCHNVSVFAFVFAALFGAQFMFRGHNRLSEWRHLQTTLHQNGLLQGEAKIADGIACDGKVFLCSIPVPCPPFFCSSFREMLVRSSWSILYSVLSSCSSVSDTPMHFFSLSPHLRWPCAVRRMLKFGYLLTHFFFEMVTNKEIFLVLTFS